MVQIVTQLNTAINTAGGRCGSGHAQRRRGRLSRRLPCHQRLDTKPLFMEPSVETSAQRSPCAKAIGRTQRGRCSGRCLTSAWTRRLAISPWATLARRSWTTTTTVRGPGRWTTKCHPRLGGPPPLPFPQSPPRLSLFWKPLTRWRSGSRTPLFLKKRNATRSGV